MGGEEVGEGDEGGVGGGGEGEDGVGGGEVVGVVDKIEGGKVRLVGGNVLEWVE